MTIAPELEAHILRYYHVEKWRIGTIARQLHVHGGTVRRVLAQAGLPRIGTRQRRSQVDAYLPFIAQTLEKFPTLTASRLYRMVRERGYPGGPDHFRHLICLHRPRPQAEAYLRLTTLPGEQGQVDWAHFGHLDIGRARRPLMAFVLVLSWSRRIFLRFFLDARMENFLRGHLAAFAAWQGCPRVLLYDNLKSAVLERQGDAIRFHPTLLAFAGHYRFEPRPVALGRGNEKGRVERAIRYVRDAFFAARTFHGLDDLNAQAEAWCAGQAADRPCPEDGRLRVREAFAAEQPRLLALPANPFPTDEVVTVQVGKTPYVRFDLNDYSIPHTQVQRLLTVHADPERVRVTDGAHVLADHPRSYERDRQVEDPAHVQTLVEHKRAARHHRGVHRLAQAAPASLDLLAGAALRGSNLGTLTAALLRLLDRHGAAELQVAIGDALQSGVPHPNAVRLALERRREARHAVPPVAPCLPPHVQEKDAPVQPHRLDTYDLLAKERDGDES
ncbi:MAG TPA: IS21 family transposase [Accumulibacter sp.]|uniref:IS21 family transposase n=1 Tax=Accumulibacter sp. TaxID=2053492 RepID=UPI0025FF681D|nr:IS21 family transposase [Accumulibacter sp.]MCM8599072.1 IS21 family transposase [Accumulibacter sp.]HNC53287.1 IS21 family transposase [Accumulibacter sp.]